MIDAAPPPKAVEIAPCKNYKRKYDGHAAHGVFTHAPADKQRICQRIDGIEQQGGHGGCCKAEHQAGELALPPMRPWRKGSRFVLFFPSFLFQASESAFVKPCGGENVAPPTEVLWRVAVIFFHLLDQAQIPLHHGIADFFLSRYADGFIRDGIISRKGSFFLSRGF